jgi:hypothetical protein
MGNFDSGRSVQEGYGEMSGLTRRRLRILVVLGVGMYSSAAAQTLPNCGDRKVQYSTFDARYSKRIVLEATTDAKVLVEDSQKQYSPQHTMWQVNVQPNYMNSGPWTTVVYIGSSGSHEALKLSLIDHSNGNAVVQWLSEKLLFVRVWWGRIYSTDFILNVQKREFVYKKMASYGDMIQPCQ